MICFLRMNEFFDPCPTGQSWTEKSNQLNLSPIARYHQLGADGQDAINFGDTFYWKPWFTPRAFERL